MCMKQKHSIYFTIEKQSEYERYSLQRQEEYNSDQHCSVTVSHTLKNMSVDYTVHKWQLRLITDISFAIKYSKVSKGVLRQAEVAQGVLGRLRPWIFLTF